MSRYIKSLAARQEYMADVIKCLGKELIPGIRNDYTDPSFHGAPALFAMERAAAPYFGIKAYGVHMNGYVERDGKKFLWVGKRSNLKPTYPGMLVPHGTSCQENLIKECEESGRTAARDETGRSLLCFMNISPVEDIREMFYFVMI
ncbi:hypothetical protein Leryth_020595 [Lithospermum erythrorhizon]|nr:hypothetical protein Leryth_020595 [Lithospermum erythrorhizon]